MTDRRGLFSLLGRLGSSRESEPFLPLLPGFDPVLQERCAACEEPRCRTECPEGIVIRTDTGVPRLDVSRRGCSFCGICADTCPHALFPSGAAGKIDAAVTISILGCMAWNKTICRSCADVCDAKAIRFVGMFHPQIDPDACTACGFCVGICPTSAIAVGSKEGSCV